MLGVIGRTEGIQGLFPLVQTALHLADGVRVCFGQDSALHTPVVCHPAVSLLHEPLTRLDMAGLPW